jgi:hypothetical protein
MSDNLSRKDIARLLDVSVEQVRANEERWGLRSARRIFNVRFIRYRKKKALDALMALGLIDETDSL